MPVLIIQQGHCYRRTGATGTEGEQAYATEVANACIRLLGGVGGWRVNPTLADENDYRGDAFVAVHCDGSTNPAARGASVGYRTPDGQALGQAWKRAYAARGWPGPFRPDNYTDALSGYYGVRNAVSAGTRRAVIIECGFMTSPLDRAALLGPGVDRVALAIGDALGITRPAPPAPIERNDEDMTLRLVKGDSTQPVPGKPYDFGDLQFYVRTDPTLEHDAERWYTRETPAQRGMSRAQGGPDVWKQADLDAVPFAEGGEIPPGVI